MNFRNRFVALLVILFRANLPGEAETDSVPSYRIVETTESITVDGALTEKIWGSLPVADGFWMSYPVDDRPVKKELRTEVRVTCDRQNIYIGATCYGSDNYVIKTLKRDAEFWDGDGFGVVIDPVNEKTNGFTFGVTPAGVQTEYLITGQAGRRADPEPGITPEGINLAWDNRWYSEVTACPDHWIVEMAVPFKTLRFNREKEVWGINFFRRDARTNSIHTWARVPIEFNEYDLGYTGTLIWDTPPGKSAGNLSLIPYIRGSVFRDFEPDKKPAYDFQPGLDAKIPVTSSLNLDMTLNSDFSQVEVDEQVVNLTLFDIRLPEKRVFFLENSDLFEDFGISPMRPFFSRRIGLDHDGNPIPILFGARLSGNVNKDLRIGLMNMQTRESGTFPAQNYTVAAFHQQVMERSVVKGYFHNRDALYSEDPDYNRNAGLEFKYRSRDGRFQSFAGYARSFSPGLNSRNYFYISGIGYDNRNLSIYTNLAGVGKNYRADMGFIPGQEYYDARRDTFFLIGYHHWFTRFSYILYTEGSDRIISHEFNARYTYDGDTAFSMLNNESEAGYALKFSSTARVSVSYNHSVVNLLYPFTFINDEPLPAGIYSFDRAEADFQSDQRRTISLRGGMSHGTFYSGTRARFTLGLRYRIQPWGNLSVHAELNDLRFPEPYGSDKLWLVGPRVEISFTRSIFWTTFLQYNTLDDNFNINSRFQWRFQPMSDLYIVYTDNYALEFWGPKYRALVFKLNYWFNL